MADASPICRMDVVAATDHPDIVRHYAALAERADGAGSIVVDRLIAEAATLVLMRDAERRTRAACHTVRDPRGVTHIRGLVKAAGQGLSPRECVALSIVYQAALGHQGFTTDCPEHPAGVRDWKERPVVRDAAALRLFAELGFETFAVVAAPEDASRSPAGRTRILNSTKATVPLARAFLSSVVHLV